MMIWDLAEADDHVGKMYSVRLVYVCIMEEKWSCLENGTIL